MQHQERGSLCSAQASSLPLASKTSKKSLARPGNPQGFSVKTLADSYTGETWAGSTVEQICDYLEVGKPGSREMTLPEGSFCTQCRGKVVSNEINSCVSMSYSCFHAQHSRPPNSVELQRCVHESRTVLAEGAPLCLTQRHGNSTQGLVAANFSPFRARGPHGSSCSGPLLWTPELGFLLVIPIIAFPQLTGQ